MHHNITLLYSTNYQYIVKYHKRAQKQHVFRTLKKKAMSESLTDRTEPQSRRGAGDARFGAKSLMQDKASYLALLRIRDYVVCLSKWLCDPKRAYAAHIRRLDMAE